MTAKKDFKRRVRERQALTGERYTTARERVQAGRNKRSPTIVELHDVSHLARGVGFACPVHVTDSLLRRANVPDLLGELHRLLVPPNDKLGPLRRAALLNEYNGERLVVVFLEGHPDRDDVVGFLENLRSGLRGPAFEGRVLTFDATTAGKRRTLVAQLCHLSPGEPVITLSVFEDADARDPHRSREAWAFALPLVLGAAS